MGKKSDRDKRGRSKSKAKAAFSRPFVPPAKVEPISIARAVDEGLLIAKSALAMDVKNHIIVTALRDDRNFAEQDVAGFVREELGKLQKEYENYSKRMDKLAVTAVDAAGPQSDSHDYRPEDYKALTKRGTIYREMAEQLKRWRKDDEFIGTVAESAREQAWSEVGRAITARLAWWIHPVGDPDYDVERESRLRTLRELDLADFAHDY
jgi:hypothetical protein